MALTPSFMIPLGTVAPDFKLLNPLTNKIDSLQDLKSPKGTVVMFICNHCPFVIHVLPELLKLTKYYGEQGVSFIAISSNDPVSHPQDGPSHMAELAKSLNFTFPYLFDDTQEVAKAYEATCTPDFFVFDGALKCVYRGQLDDSRPNNGVPLSGQDLRSALDGLLSSNPISPEQKPSMGCNIKWKN